MKGSSRKGTNHDQGKSGAFDYGRCGTGRGFAARGALSREKNVWHLSTSGADPEEQTVCVSVKGQGYGGESGQAPWEAGSVYCKVQRDVPGRFSVLPVEKWRLADEGSAGKVFGKNLNCEYGLI